MVAFCSLIPWLFNIFGSFILGFSGISLSSLLLIGLVFFVDASTSMLESSSGSLVAFSRPEEFPGGIG